MHADSAVHWVSHYGHQITSLSVGGSGWPLQQLACPNLLELSVNICDVFSAAAAGDGQSWFNQDCTKLTRLHLVCDTRDTPEGAVIDGLSRLVHLQHLGILSELARYQFGGLSATLSRMQQLTFLQFHSLSVEDVLQLGSLSRLQVLHFSAAGDVAVGPRSVPGLLFPTSLTMLVLLSPVEAGLLSLVPTGLQDLRVQCDVEGIQRELVQLRDMQAVLQRQCRQVAQARTAGDQASKVPRAPWCGWGCVINVVILLHMKCCSCQVRQRAVGRKDIGPDALWPSSIKHYKVHQVAAGGEC